MEKINSSWENLKSNFNFNEYVLNALNDKKLTIEERKMILEYLTEKNKITNQTYTNWNKLAKETKLLLQDEVWTAQDWKIWKDTLRKLKNYKHLEQKNEIISHIDSHETEIKKIWEKLVKNVSINNNNLSINNNIDNPSEFKISTHNDWMIINSWSDTWNTAWINLNYTNNNYKLTWDYEIYTHGEKKIVKKSWNTHTSYKDSHRNDQININLQKSVYEKKFNDWSSIKAYLWWWITWIWNFWWDIVQNWTHKLFWKNENLSTYEDTQWITPTINATIEWEKKLLRIWELNINTSWNITMQKSINSWVWEDNIKAKVKLWWEYKWFETWVYTELKYRNWVNNSNVISNSLNEDANNYNWAYISYTTSNDTTIYMDLATKKQISISLSQKF